MSASVPQMAPHPRLPLLPLETGIDGSIWRLVTGSGALDALFVAAEGLKMSPDPLLISCKLTALEIRGL